VKLFQIEEPEGGPADPDLPGAAIGVDVSGGVAEAAFSVGGNAVILNDRPEFVRILAVPKAIEAAEEWQALFEGLRLRAERLLARPVTHAAIVLAALPPPAAAEVLRIAAARAGVDILRLLSAAELSAADGPALAAARIAEDLVPRPGTEGLSPAYCK
jgi:hypothetical protein